METVFTNHYQTIEIENMDELTNIWFTGDWHVGCAGHDEDRFNYFLHKAAKDKEKTFYVGMGDYFDFASSSEQKDMKKGKLHETTIAMFDEIVESNVSKLAQKIKQMRGNMIGLVEGNHSWTYANGNTATKDLAERLTTKELGWLSFVTLNFNIKSRSKNVKVTMVLCHGKAGGKLMGNSVNQIDDLKRIFPTADIYVMGHDHQRFAVPSTVILPIYQNNKTYLKQKRQFLCRSGSFLKSYTENKSEYVTGRLLKPSDLGAIKLQIGFHKDKKDNYETIITDITAFI